MRVQKPDELFELELGVWLGHRQALAALAGGRLAADAECLRHAHDHKTYRALGLTWDEFCKQRFGMTSQTANRMIRRLKELGPQGFRPKQATGITEEEYLRIADAIAARSRLRRPCQNLSRPMMAVPDVGRSRGGANSDSRRAALNKSIEKPQ